MSLCCVLPYFALVNILSGIITADDDIVLFTLDVFESDGRNVQSLLDQCDAGTRGHRECDGLEGQSRTGKCTCLSESCFVIGRGGHD
jgi:hypothetical protein